MAVEPRVVVIPCVPPKNLANCSSNAPMYLPAELIHPVSIASATYFFDSGVMTGSFTGTNIGGVIVDLGKSLIACRQGTAPASLRSCVSVRGYRYHDLRGETKGSHRSPAPAPPALSNPHRTLSRGLCLSRCTEIRTCDSHRTAATHAGAASQYVPPDVP